MEIAIPTTVNSRKFVLSYDEHGVAKLHSSCWKNVLSVGFIHFISILLLKFLNEII